MPIDREKALAAEFPAGEGEYAADDVILYHLGIGAGNPPTDANELEYTYEKNLKVLPTFAVVARSGGGGGLRGLPGLEFNPAMLLHGEQSVVVHRPLPTSAKLRGKTRIKDVYDKGKAALVVLENEVSDDSGELLYTTGMSLFLRGEGGFGGPSGPKVSNEKPDRAPDGVVETRTLPQQALLYRLCGDKNPLHADPEFAKAGGFDQPIIHGLCSYGHTCKAIVDHVLGGDVTKVKGYEARFRGVGFPGETYVTSYWQEGNTLLVESKSKERDAIIISNAAMTLAS
ncbi:MaoC family dehydratase N-terminal domain-containing protein [Myxococcota bacterium]|nr:MaoC family dehydratase N-terminal domain-containing protein [Myxococcota bacterium]